MVKATARQWRLELHCRLVTKQMRRRVRSAKGKIAKRPNKRKLTKIVTTANNKSQIMQRLQLRVSCEARTTRPRRLPYRPQAHVRTHWQCWHLGVRALAFFLASHWRVHCRMSDVNR